MLAKLAAQIQLAQDCSYQSTKTQYIADSEGKMTLVQRSERIQRWWSVKADGTVQLTTRYGSKPQALAKGKNAFELAGESELVSTLEQIQTAVKQGEFDELIEQQKAWRNRVNTIKAEKPKIETAV